MEARLLCCLLPQGPRIKNRRIESLNYMLPSFSQRIAIITPALSDAKNGNWETARRWHLFLSKHYQVTVTREFVLDTSIESSDLSTDLLIGLHARRSHSAIKTFAQLGRPIVVVLTGTDLYGDTPSHPQVQESLELATQIVTLQADALELLPTAFRAKARVIFQSAASVTPINKNLKTFDICFIAHRRKEKDPSTVLSAFKQFDSLRARLVHVGRLDDYEQEFNAAAKLDDRISLLGAMTNDEARAVLARGSVMVLASKMEGGANVIIEAVTSGVVVIASRISGNIGMLGADYPGYFSYGNVGELLALLTRCEQDVGFMNLLQTHCENMASQFAPAQEEQRVQALAASLLLPQ